MTIFGVAGCTALLVTGFGLSDSLNGLVNRQFTNIIHYDLLSVFDSDSQPEDLATYEQALASNEKIDKYGQVTAKEEGIAKQNITLIARAEIPAVFIGCAVLILVGILIPIREARKEGSSLQETNLNS